MQIPFIDAGAVRRNLSMEVCIRLMASTMKNLSKSPPQFPRRTFVALGAEPAGRFLVSMPGQYEEEQIFGAKLVSFYPEKGQAGEQSVEGVVILFSLHDGSPIAIVDAAAITALRTAAASAAATDVLAKRDSSVLVIIGYGTQAQSHLQAMLRIRPIQEAIICGRSSDRIVRFIQQASVPRPVRLDGTTDVEGAVRKADIVCTVTTSQTPVLKGNWLTEGAHVNLVGAHSPETREADSETLKRARVFVELLEFALKEAGDITIPIEEGAIEHSDIVGEVGAVMTGAILGRTSERDITVYKSLGNVLQDLVAANAAYCNWKIDERAQVGDVGATGR
jgi:ornithine cyclodeaminase